MNIIKKYGIITLIIISFLLSKVYIQFDGIVGNLIIALICSVILFISYIGTIENNVISEIIIVLTMAYFTCRYGLQIPMHEHANMHLSNLIYIAMFISTVKMSIRIIKTRLKVIKIIVIGLTSIVMNLIFLLVVLRMIWPSSEIIFDNGNERLTQTNFGAMSSYTYELTKYNTIIDIENILVIKILTSNEYHDGYIG